jgi:hypothetical protein
MDSIVSEEITYDLFCEIDRITKGDIPILEALRRKV